MTAWDVRIESAHSHGPGLSSFLGGGRPWVSLGLSRASPASNRSRLSSTLSWLAARSSAIAVVEGSFLARWNAMALGDLSEAEASRAARREAGVVRRRVERILSALALDDRARFLDWEELVATPDVAFAIREIEAYGRNEAPFRKMIDSEVHDFLARTGGKTLRPSSKGERDLLRRYVVEEIAVLLDLQRRGYPIEVYHGPDLALLAAISEGGFPGFPVASGKRTHVGIALVRTEAVGGAPR